MTKQHALIAAMAIAIVGLAATSPALAAENLTNYGWNVLMDNADYYWSFNEAGATDAAQDAARGQANDQLEAKFGATRVAGQSANLGQAAAFNGVESVFHADALADDKFSGAWAMELWFQMDAPATNQSVYLLNMMGTGGGGTPSVIYGYNADTLEVHTPGGRTGTAVPAITDTSWHHLVVTCYGNSDGTIGVANRFDMTVDGTTTSISPHDLWPDMNVNGALNVGRWTDYAGGAFDGQIDELAIYDLSGMTESQVAAKSADIADHRNLINAAAAPSLAMVDPADVTYSITPGLVPVYTGVYGDTSGDELADGLYSSTAQNLDEPNSMAFYDPVAENADYGEAIFDLGSIKDLGGVWVDYLAGGGKWGVKAPESFELSFSEDGVTYSTPITLDTNDENFGQIAFHSRRAISELSGVDAQYVKLGVNKVGTFAFLSEVSFIENVSPVPEPSTIILLVGMIAALGVIRRKR